MLDLDKWVGHWTSSTNIALPGALASAVSNANHFKRRQCFPVTAFVDCEVVIGSASRDHARRHGKPWRPGVGTPGGVERLAAHSNVLVAARASPWDKVNNC